MDNDDSIESNIKIDVSKTPGQKLNKMQWCKRGRKHRDTDLHIVAIIHYFIIIVVTYSK